MCSSSNTSAKSSNKFPYKWVSGALYVAAIIIAGFYYIPKRCSSINCAESDLSTVSDSQQLQDQIEWLENELAIKNDIIKSQKELLDWKEELIKSLKEK